MGWSVVALGWFDAGSSVVPTTAEATAGDSMSLAPSL
jgi:hypothetical protein